MSKPKEKPALSIFWFRRDLRLDDNAGLFHALKGEFPVLPIFIFDKSILDKLSDSRDARVYFIWKEVHALKERLQNEFGSSLLIRYGEVDDVFASLLDEFDIKGVYANRDYEPSAVERDQKVYNYLQDQGIKFRAFKDQVIFDKSEVVKEDGTPYEVYTPYMKKYKSQLSDFYLSSYPTLKYASNFFATNHFDNITLKEMGFEQAYVDFPSRSIDEELIRNYHKTRDIPSVEGTSRLSLHLRFGTISIRKLARLSKDLNSKFFNELIWRDFYQMIMYHFPETVNKAFKPQYDKVKWEHNEEHFNRWCEGQTGYPLVDAGMRQLNETGYMHNRIRMLTASFLSKHLLLDWRWGEAYFAEKLLDYDQASNVGGWQWAAGCGVDAAPYFRIFNPELQQKKFDPDFKYIKQWVKEFDTEDYPEPIVVHKEARERALSRYKQALS